MDLNIIFLKTERGLSPEHKRKLRKIIGCHAKRAMRLLGVKLLNITIYPDENNYLIIPETGEGGCTMNSDWIQVFIDPSRTKNELDKIIANIMPATVYHEISHISQEYLYFKPSKPLLASVIDEGLADEFAKEEWPSFKAPWAQYSLKEIRPFLKQFSKEKNNKKYWHEDWFFGQGKKPRWLGYKLGSFIIQTVKNKNRGGTAREMTKWKMEKIIKLSGLKI